MINEADGQGRLPNCYDCPGGLTDSDCNECSTLDKSFKRTTEPTRKSGEVSGSAVTRGEDKLLFERLLKITNGNRELSAFLHDVAIKIEKNEKLIKQIMPDLT